MSITQKDVSSAYGPAPKTRYPTPAAHLVSQCLSTALPALSPAAGRILSHHLNEVARLNPEKGTTDALDSIASDFNLPRHPLAGPEAMQRADAENHPLAAFMNEGRRLTRHESTGGSAMQALKVLHRRNEGREAMASKGGFNFGSFIKEVARPHIASFSPSSVDNLVNKMQNGGCKSDRDVCRVRDEIISLAEAEGGFDFSGFLKGVANNPFAQMAAQAAMQKLTGGGVVGGFDFSGFLKSAVNNPYAQMAAQAALQKLTGGGVVGGCRDPCYIEECEVDTLADEIVRMDREAEGGFDFKGFLKSAANNPFAQMAAQAALQKLTGGKKKSKAKGGSTIAKSAKKGSLYSAFSA